MLSLTLLIGKRQTAVSKIEAVLIGFQPGH